MCLHRCVWIVYDLNWRKVCLTASHTIRCNAMSVTRNKLLLTQNLHWFRHGEQQYWRACEEKKITYSLGFYLTKIYKEAQTTNLFEALVLGSWMHYTCEALLLEFGIRQWCTGFGFLLCWVINNTWVQMGCNYGLLVDWKSVITLVHLNTIMVHNVWSNTWSRCVPLVFPHCVTTVLCTLEKEILVYQAKCKRNSWWR